MDRYLITAGINGIQLKFFTSKDVFSPREVDRGTLAMLSYADLKDGDKVLDLGCGYGAVGIYASKVIGGSSVFMSDVYENAIKLSIDNSELNDVKPFIFLSDGFKSITEKDFTLILSNPPYHTDFSVAKEFIEKGFNRLSLGGRMIMVTKRREWYKNKLGSIFGGCRIIEKDGYNVFIAEKRDYAYAKVKGKGR
jgi:16S rRNA (guanine1207-N2)-methyltransferase